MGLRWLAAGFSFVNISTICALLLGMGAGGLNRVVAFLSIVAGVIAGSAAYFQTHDQPRIRKHSNAAIPPDLNVLPKRSGSQARKSTVASAITRPVERYRYLALWLLVACFVMFAVRSFCWLLYAEGNDLKIQSPNNLGDLSLHLTYIRNFANGAPLWPDNPIYVFSKMRYPAGTDLFNALLLCLGLDVTRGLVWTGLVASAATCFAFYRWSGSFGIAAFLFNGGLAGFQYLWSFSFIDYQGDKTMAWKSIPLAMFVTQRGLLYAIPVGLLLLCCWRAKFFPGRERSEESVTRLSLPLWVQLSLYASMPLFHVHTFIALTIVLGCFFLMGDSPARKQSALLATCAFLPSTFFVWLITDQFHAGSVLKWQPGWVQHSGDFARSFPWFWLVNFGLWVPLIVWFVGLIAWKAWKNRQSPDFKISDTMCFLVAGIGIFLLAYLVKTAPWEWDNIKLLIWAYFIVLPFLWAELIAQWPFPARAAVCLALFGSGFVTLVGGLSAERTGFGLADRAEVDAVGVVLGKLPIEARFAAFPTYNHPLLLQGRKVVLGYPGHLWTQGFNYNETYDKLVTLMQGAPDWRQTARFFQARYLFWGREERMNYPLSTRPWEQESSLVASGAWGAIYDLELPRNPAPAQTP